MAILMQPRTEKEIRRLGVNNVREEYFKLSNDYNRIINGDVLFCPKCGKWQATDTTYYMDKRYVTGRYPICKKCIMKMVEQKNKDDDPSNETRESVQSVLKMMDLPFDSDFYDDCVKGALDDIRERKKGSPFATYITSLLSLPNWRGMTWKDSKFGDSADTPDEIRLNQRTIKAAKKRFGSGYTNEELMFLENEYQEWVSRYECSTKAQEEVFENLSICKLLKRKSLNSGKGTKDLDAQMQQWLDTGNLKPKQNNLDALSDAQTLGTLLQKYEEEKPLPTLDPELEDVDGIGRYINAFYMGHICKMFGLKNEYAQQYEEEMAKYTVTPPEYSEDGEDEDGINMDKILGVTQDG